MDSWWRCGVQRCKETSFRCLWRETITPTPTPKKTDCIWNTALLYIIMIYMYVHKRTLHLYIKIYNTYMLYWMVEHQPKVLTEALMVGWCFHVFRVLFFIFLVMLWWWWSQKTKLGSFTPNDERKQSISISRVPQNENCVELPTGNTTG